MNMGDLRSSRARLARASAALRVMVRFEFDGTFTSISWTNPTFENWYGFAVGVAETPLPSTWTMLIAGFAGLGFFSYIGSRKKSFVGLAA